MAAIRRNAVLTPEQLDSNRNEAPMMKTRSKDHVAAESGRMASLQTRPEHSNTD